MTKSNITQLADFVRGLMDPEAEQQIESYLAGAPSSTQRELAALRHVARLAAEDQRHPIPAHAVRCAKALGSLRRPQGSTEPSLLKRLALALTFDSHSAPALAGIRGLASMGNSNVMGQGSSMGRQLVFRSEGYQIDLRLESHGQGTVVVGQLVREDEEVEPMAQVPVLAMADQEVLARVETGRLGEFQAAGLPAEPFELLFLVDDDLSIEASLG